jgi:hypothetical protein
MQSNQDILDSNLSIIDEEIWKILYEKLLKKESLLLTSKYIQEISLDYNLDKKNIIKDFLNYIIRNNPCIVNKKFLSFVENIMHFQECQTNHYVSYVLVSLSEIV